MTENFNLFAANEGAMNVPICPTFNVIFSPNTFTVVDADQDNNAHQNTGATRPNLSQSCLFYCAVGTDRVCLVVSVITIMSVVRLFTAVYKFYHAADFLHAVCVCFVQTLIILVELYYITYYFVIKFNVTMCSLPKASAK